PETPECDAQTPHHDVPTRPPVTRGLPEGIDVRARTHRTVANATARLARLIRHVRIAARPGQRPARIAECLSSIGVNQARTRERREAQRQRQDEGPTTILRESMHEIPSSPSINHATSCTRP